MLIHRFATLTGLAVVTLFLAAPANALTMAECSTKYNTAKDAGTLGGQTWNQFRKAECGTDAGATHGRHQTGQEAAKATEAAKAAAKAAATDAAPGLTAKECGTKYQAAKAAGTLNGMKWNDFRKTECAAGASRPRPSLPRRNQGGCHHHDPAGEAKGLTTKECSTKYQAAKDRRHAERHEVERLPQDRMRRCRRDGGAAAEATTKATTTKAAAATRPARA